ncbi:hypothetical protein TWF506_004281 [Arthrobotrys conoides]|uniref:Essential protein Yae1 N-terminal domain-containing protein n=1 Tax=Arthrobotrys conoides TaxID=74498 RepID=A0AAN8RPF8_9PEZI
MAPSVWSYVWPWWGTCACSTQGGVLPYHPETGLLDPQTSSTLSTNSPETFETSFNIKLKILKNLIVTMTDLLDAVLNLEEDYYNLGHAEGSLAGATAGRLEGRAFGIEKGFEKYLALGIIKGRTKVWQSRTSPSLPSVSSSSSSSFDTQKIIITNPRHLKHLELLQTLSTTPPIRNEEDDVEEVDDRIRRGKAKVKILENTLREGVPVHEDGEDGDAIEVEKDGSRAPRKLRSGVAISGATGLETEFEDFKIRRS